MKENNLTANELQVLSSLLSKKRYGIEIIETIEEAGGRMLLGSLYNVLKNLEDKDFVESQWNDEGNGKNHHRRKYYRITAKGQKVVNDYQNSLSILWQPIF